MYIPAVVEKTHEEEVSRRLFAVHTLC